MFYPVESLKRGGRFYLCWVADSWPLRFATITHRQLWSQDIRRICDDLLEVMTNESGRPINRFSLRLSSQLMRGLVRLYQKKVTVFLGDLCMINAYVTKHVNKKWNIQEEAVVPAIHRPQLQLVPQQLMIQEEPENEQRIEEIIQNSGNVVGNIHDITLKECTIPQFQPPVNDGFGEENQDQALQLAVNQTLEMMLVQDASAAQHSGLELALDTTGDKSHDKSRPLLDAPVMERIDEMDVTLYPKSITAEDRLTLGDLGKDIPEIPDIPLLELPGLPAAPQVEEPPVEVVPIPGPEHTHETEKQQAQERELVEIELEELEDVPPAAKRRRLRRLIIDKKIKLSADYLVTRIENPKVELRCEDSSDDIVVIRVPTDVYFRRPAHAGPKYSGGIAFPLTRLFQKNLCVHNRQPSAEREMEEAVAERSRRVRTRSGLQRIEEDRELLIPEKPALEIEHQLAPENRQSIPVDVQNVTLPQLIVEPPDMAMVGDVAAASAQRFLPEDIADLPTQKIVEEDIAVQSQPRVLTEARKRKSDYETTPKRQRLMGYVSFRQSQQLYMELPLDIEAEKENLPSAANLPRITRSQPLQESPEKTLTVLLQEAGLADLPPRPEDEVPVIRREVEHRDATKGSDSETPLGSLDRTKVSLGDSDQTTESRRFIRDQWGTEGTMVKILGSVKAGLKPLTVQRLIAKGPIIVGCKAIIAARCFTSILKLKQHGFVVINKDPESLEITDIFLGPKFDQV